jgi:hypothetical protein
MTVEQLIARLRELPLDAIVVVRDSDGELVRVDDADLVHVSRAADSQRVYIAGS